MRVRTAMATQAQSSRRGTPVSRAALTGTRALVMPGGPAWLSLPILASRSARHTRPMTTTGART
jgi:hypothetical protein